MLTVCLYVTLLAVTSALETVEVCRVNLAMVVDKSGSIGRDEPYGKMENWYNVQDFLKKIVTRLEIGTDAVMISLTTFSNRAHPEFNFANKSKEAMIEHVSNLDYGSKGGRTNTDAGLKMAESMLLEYKRKRPDAKDIILLITDGKATPVLNGDLTSTVQRLKQQGVRIIGIGVTDLVDVEELQQIVSDPSTDYFNITQFNELMTALDDIIEEVCRVIRCPGDKVYSTCIYDNCTKTCMNQNPEEANPAVCGTECRSGCACPDDRQFEFPNDQCGTKDLCDCPGDKIYSECALDNCEKTCENRDPVCGTECHVGCVCPIETPFSLPDDLCGTEEDCPAADIDGCVLDLFLVVDESGSIARDAPTNNWLIMRQFIESILSGLPIGLSTIRVGMVMFGNDARGIFQLNTYADRDSIMDALETIECRCLDGGKTNTTGALRFTRQNYFTPEAGDRAHATDVVLLITDGIDNVETDGLMDEVNMIKNLGARIMVVGLTDEIDREELKMVATSPDRHYFEVAQFRELMSVLEDILAETCANQCPAPAPIENIIAFSAYISEAQIAVLPDSRVVFDGVYTNVGGAYNANTGVFTCPCRGLYLFFHQWGDVEHGLSTAIVHRGQVVGPLAIVYAHGAMSTNTVAVCNAREEVFVKIISMASSGILQCSHEGLSKVGFSGTMLHPMP